MKRLFLFLLFCTAPILAQSIGAGETIVHHNVNFVGGFSTGFSTSSGNSVLVIYNGAGSTTITDNKGSTYNEFKTSGGCCRNINVAIACNVTSGPLTINSSTSGGTVSVDVWEISGADTSSSSSCVGGHFTAVSATSCSNCTTNNLTKQDSTTISLNFTQSGGSFDTVGLEILNSTGDGSVATISVATQGSSPSPITLSGTLTNSTFYLTAYQGASYTSPPPPPPPPPPPCYGGGYAKYTGYAQFVGFLQTISYCDGTAYTTGNIAGTVTDATTGNPISGATVKTGVFSVTTASDGTYELDNLRVGTFSSTVSASGYDTFQQNITIYANTTTEYDVALNPHTGGGVGTVSGTITDSTTHKVISGVGVNFSGGSTTTNSSGFYSFSSVGTGTYSFTFSATGYISESHNASVTSSNNTNLNEDLTPTGTTGGSTCGSGNGWVKVSNIQDYDPPPSPNVAYQWQDCGNCGNTGGKGSKAHGTYSWSAQTDGSQIVHINPAASYDDFYWYIHINHPANYPQKFCHHIEYTFQTGACAVSQGFEHQLEYRNGVYTCNMAYAAYNSSHSYKYFHYVGHAGGNWIDTHIPFSCVDNHKYVEDDLFTVDAAHNTVTHESFTIDGVTHTIGATQACIFKTSTNKYLDPSFQMDSKGAYAPYSVDVDNMNAYWLP